MFSVQFQLSREVQEDLTGRIKSNIDKHTLGMDSSLKVTHSISSSLSFAFLAPKIKILTLKAPNKNCSRRHFNFLLLSFEELRLDFSCESSAEVQVTTAAEDSLEYFFSVF